MLKNAVGEILIPVFLNVGFEVRDYVGERGKAIKRDAPHGNLVRSGDRGELQMLGFQFGAQGAPRFTINFATIPATGLEGMPVEECDAEMAMVRRRIYKNGDPMKWFQLPWYRKKTEANYRNYVASLKPYMQEVILFFDTGEEGQNVHKYQVGKPM